MTHKSHTKLAFNHIASNKTASHFLSNIKSISTYSLLTTLFALFTITASMTPAQAELVDLSNPEPVIKFASRDASWLKPPSFNFARQSLRCTDKETGEPIKVVRGQKLKILLELLVDRQGKISRISVKESSGNRCFDRSAARQIRSGQMRPFVFEGKAIRGKVDVPIVFIAE
ncbi:TonB family protein [Psychrobacter sp. SCQQ22]|uniref:energy transducer TonB n=1 Tax=Psychrobacter sp. SCQQ22 TaxID=2792059 RepID=UPI0018CCA631|nr:energy transducer TonB [Psychrobacter sp. SCQQ22]MBH0085053.1 TonB family protein [Psychrobacter sp. SCQQ22]